MKISKQPSFNGVYKFEPNTPFKDKAKFMDLLNKNNIRSTLSDDQFFISQYDQYLPKSRDNYLLVNDANGNDYTNIKVFLNNTENDEDLAAFIMVNSQEQKLYTKNKLKPTLNKFFKDNIVKKAELLTNDTMSIFKESLKYMPEYAKKTFNQLVKKEK